jgi:hypothetical protein
MWNYRTIALQFTLTGAEGFYLPPILVIDIIPVLCGFNVADALSLQS